MPTVELGEVESRHVANKVVVVDFDPVQAAKSRRKFGRNGPSNVIIIQPQPLELGECNHCLGEDPTQIVVVELHFGDVAARTSDSHAIRIRVQASTRIRPQVGTIVPPCSVEGVVHILPR